MPPQVRARKKGPIAVGGLQKRKSLLVEPFRLLVSSQSTVCNRQAVETNAGKNGVTGCLSVVDCRLERFRRSGVVVLFHEAVSGIH